MYFTFEFDDFTRYNELNVHSIKLDLMKYVTMSNYRPIAATYTGLIQYMNDTTLQQIFITVIGILHSDRVLKI